MVAIPPRVKRLWDKWNIRGFLIASLMLQTCLILFAPLRKRTAHKLVIVSLWSGYLLADWAANFAVGLISNGQGDTTSTADENLLAFWPPFLLLHLGGPDTITAFALEDNELWLRHLLGLVFQVIAAGYVFLQTIPKNSLWLPTTLLFLAGIIKYAERTRALYLASLNSFRDSMLKEPDPGPNYAKLMEEYASKKDAMLPTKISIIAEPNKEIRALNRNVVDGPLNNIQVVQKAYYFFNIFKGLIVDLIFSFRERNESREYFRQRNAEEALSIIEVELNFIYEVLYTKFVVMHHMVGYLFRFVAFALVLASLVLFYRRKGKNEYDDKNVGITYTLLYGAIGLDIISFIMLLLSDWTVAARNNYRIDSFPGNIFVKFLDLKQPRWSKISGCNIKPYDRYSVLSRPVFFRRWSESFQRYNLISYCLKERPNKIQKINYCKALYCLGVVISKGFSYVGLIVKCVIHSLGALVYKFIPCLKPTLTKLRHHWQIFVEKVIDYLGAGAFLDEIRYVSSAPLTKELWEFIYTELKEKSERAEDSETSRHISSARGEWVLRNGEPADSKEENKLLAYVEDVDYDESILLWHIATDLCYHRDDNIDDDNREFSKMLSDYMLYLLILQPTMMSAVAGIGEIRFRDTCAEANNFFKRRMIQKGENSQQNACKKILEVNTDVKPVEVKGDRSKSVLFDGSILAKELRKMDNKKKWMIMSKVWVELLSYAASHCRANSHAQQVSKGGELISFVWLLMAHLGLGEQFQINEGHARAKLIVGK